VVNEVLDGIEMKESLDAYDASPFAADVAVKIDDAIQSRIVVDWRGNFDIQNDMRNAIDDLLYDAKANQGMLLSTQDMDSIIERALDIARNRYPK
jgi:hypothetical protein